MKTFLSKDEQTVMANVLAAGPQGRACSDLDAEAIATLTAMSRRPQPHRLIILNKETARFRLTAAGKRWIERALAIVVPS